MKRDNKSEIEAKKFKGYFRIWVDTSNLFEAGEWMAAHIGHLVANVDRLQKQVKRLEKLAMKKGKK